VNREWLINVVELKKQLLILNIIIETVASGIVGCTLR